MGFINNISAFINKLIGKQEKIQEIAQYKAEKLVEEIHSLWDYIKFNEQSQAHHICSILGFEEWVDMEEILRRIKELFGAEYQNERSLYPYIKTLVDCGLVETTAFGGKRKWRKKEVLIKIKSKTTEKRETEEIQAKNN